MEARAVKARQRVISAAAAFSRPILSAFKGGMAVIASAGIRLAPRNSAIRRVVLYLMQICVTVVLFWGVMEAWTRLSYPERKVLWPSTFDPRLGFVFQPNSIVRWTNGLDFDVTTQSNEAGFLDRPLPPVEKPADSCRIAVIGDSFVEAAQVPINDKAHVVLERLARKRWPGNRFETMGLGYSGTGQLNQLPFFEELAKPRKPDLVVLVFVENDFANNSALLEGIRNGWDPFHSPRLFALRNASGAIELQPISADWQQHAIPPLQRPETTFHRLLKASHFYGWLHAKIALLYPAAAAYLSGSVSYDDLLSARIDHIARTHPQLSGQLAEWNSPAKSIDGLFYDAELPKTFSDAIDYSRFGFEQFQRGTAQIGAKLAVVSSQGVSGRYFERLRHITDRTGIPTLSMHDYLMKKGMQTSDVHWRHDSHWNERGHEIAAELLLTLLEQSGVCGLGPPARGTAQRD